MQKRLEWIDCAKGVGITLIVLGHSGIPNVAVPFLYSFHVPLLFMASGLTLRPERPLKIFLKNCAKHTLLPYLIASITLNLSLFLFPSQEISSLPDILKEFFFTGGEYGHWFFINLWFLPCLFFTQIYIYVYVHVCGFLHFKKCQRVLISLLIGLAGAGLVSYQTKLPASLDLIPITQFFVGIAYEYKEEISNLRNAKWTTVLVQFILFLILLSQNGNVDLFGRGTSNPINYYATALMGSIVIFPFRSRFVEKNPGIIVGLRPLLYAWE